MINAFKSFRKYQVRLSWHLGQLEGEGGGEEVWVCEQNLEGSIFGLGSAEVFNSKVVFSNLCVCVDIVRSIRGL